MVAAAATASPFVSLMVLALTFVWTVAAFRNRSAGLDGATGSDERPFWSGRRAVVDGESVRCRRTVEVVAAEAAAEALPGVLFSFVKLLVLP